MKLQTAPLLSTTLMYMTTVLLVAICISHAKAETKEFTPTADTFISQEKQGQPGDRSHRNYGAAHSLRADTQYSGEKSHVLLKFDLSDIPKDANITGAILVMGSPVKPTVGSLEVIEIRRLLRDDWVEGTQGHETHVSHTAVSWLAVRYEDEKPIAWSTPGATGEKDSDAKNKIVIDTDPAMTLAKGAPVTSLVQTWSADRAVAFGVLIRTSNEKINYLGWASKEMPDAEGPVLVVEWTTP